MMWFHLYGEGRRRLGRSLAGVLAAGLLLGASAGASDRVPSAMDQEVLIKTSLLTLNDANISGNYAVLHTKLAKPFREQFDPNRLKQAFKGFADQGIDMSAIAAKPPIAAGDAQIDNRGALLLRGRFDVGRSKVVYALDFLPSEGEWKPISLQVDVKPATGM